MKRNLTILLTIIFIGFVGIGINDIRKSDVQLELKSIELQDRALELNQLRLDKEKLNQKFEEAINDKEINTEKVKQLEQEKLDLEERTRKLEGELQAKREREANEKRIASVGISERASAQSVPVTGNKESWLRASGIPESEWWAVDSIVSGESGWRPDAYNTSSGACGLGQQLPCGKWGGDWKDPVHALKSMNTYVQDYGGWIEAVEFRNCTGTCYSARTGGNVYKDHTWY